MNEKELDVLIEKINFLSKKKKTQGLSEEELAEQQRLRQIYLDSFRKSLKTQLDNIDIEYVD